MKVKLIVMDYLQLVRADARDVRERVGKVADALRQLAKSERVPVVLLSQLRRPQNVNDAPTMIDLKESGDIEAHAHVVLLLHVPTGPVESQRVRTPSSSARTETVLGVRFRSCLARTSCAFIRDPWNASTSRAMEMGGTMNSGMVIASAEIGGNLVSGRLLSLCDVAARLGVSRAWVRDHATRRNPRIPVVRIGGKRAVLRFRPQDIENFINAHLQVQQGGV